MSASKRYRENIAALTETFEYAERVVSKMPGETRADRKARWLRYAAILDEWHKARIRWKITQP